MSDRKEMKYKPVVKVGPYAVPPPVPLNVNLYMYELEFDK